MPELAENIGTITDIGAWYFNQYYLNSTYRIMFCGVKVSSIPEPAPNSSDTKNTVDGLKELNALQGQVYPNNTYIPIASVSSQSNKDDDDQIVQITVGLNRPIADMDADVKIHEIGVYAQLCQNDPPTYSKTLTYRAGDIVRSAQTGDLYKSLHDGNTAELADAESWMLLPTPLAQYILPNQRWYPILGEGGNPFLFYVMAKHKHPLCLSDNFTIRYSLNLKLLDNKQYEQLYISPEDMHGFPEVQLAYLENISQAMRAARNEQRIAEVAIRSLQGDFVPDMPYNQGDVVRKDGKLWILVNSQNWSGMQLLHRLKEFPSPTTLVSVGWGGQYNDIAMIGWIWLSPAIINLIDTWDRTANGNSYVKGHIVVWKRRLFYRRRAPYENNPEPGSTDSLASTYWTEFKIGKGT